jgi:hypothetical protein
MFAVRRSIATLALAISVVLAACTDDGDDPTPDVHLAACVNNAAKPARSAKPAGSATPARSSAPRVVGSLSEQDRGELFRRNQAANKAFRERHPLPPKVQAANQPCVDAVRDGLFGLRADGRYDADSIRQVLASTGLTALTVRPPGRLDLAGSGGLLFAGSTGQGCVFGEYGIKPLEVSFGSQVADGGCLPAAD